MLDIQISEDEILEYFFWFFPRKKALEFHANCLTLSHKERLCMIYQSLVSLKNKVIITKFSSVELTYREMKVNTGKVLQISIWKIS